MTSSQDPGQSDDEPSEAGDAVIAEATREIPPSPRASGRVERFGLFLGWARRVIGCGIAALAAWGVVEMATSEVTLSDWRFLATRVCGAAGCAALCLGSPVRIRGRASRVAAIVATVVSIALIAMPSIMLKHDADVMIAALNLANQAYVEGARSRMDDLPGGTREQRCEALERFLWAMRDRVPGRGSVTGCTGRWDDSSTRPAPFDRVGHLRDVFLGGVMHVLPIPTPPNGAPRLGI